MGKYQWIKIGNVLVGLLSGLGINWLSDYLGGINSIQVKLCIVFLIILGIVLSFVQVLRKRNVIVDHYQQFPLRDERDNNTNARSGLVVVVSPYNLLPKDENKANLLIKKAVIGDYTMMDFEKSNMGHVVKAITTHKDKLTHCWVLSTQNTSGDNPGSYIYVPALIAYLQDKYGMKNVLFDWKDQIISMNDDADITRRTKEIINKILSSKDTPKDTITDFTGGVRSITLGIFLTCLQMDRDVQMIGTRYDKNGHFTPDSFGLISKFDVKAID
jgi:hypothetical protein